MTEFPGLRAAITGTGAATPKRVMTNREFESLVETTDEWIVQRTGIRERRVCSREETTGSLSLEAARMALKDAGVDAHELDLIVVATVTGDHLWPATACQIQGELGAESAAAYDISAACAGFIYGLANVGSLIATGQVKKALLIGADCLTKQMDWTDRSTCILFGDGAGACVLEAHQGSDRGLIATVMKSDGKAFKHIILERGGNKYPYADPAGADKSCFIKMNGQEVYRYAVHAMGEACEAVLAKAGMSTDEVDLFVPHQANLRIIESAAKRLDLPWEKVFINVDRYGNTSGASVPLALDEARRSGTLKQGMTVLTVGFGAGLVWGANLTRM